MWDATYHDLQRQVKTLSARLAEFELEDEAPVAAEVVATPQPVETPTLIPMSPLTVTTTSMMTSTYPVAGAGAAPAPTASPSAGAGAIEAFNASSAATAASTSCLASVRKDASCSPAR